MQVGSSGFCLGVVEVVAQSVGRDVTAVRACNDEIRGLFAVARFAD